MVYAACLWNGLNGLIEIYRFVDQCNWSADLSVSTDGRGTINQKCLVSSLSFDKTSTTWLIVCHLFTIDNELAFTKLMWIQLNWRLLINDWRRLDWTPSTGCRRQWVGESIELLWLVARTSLQQCPARCEKVRNRQLCTFCCGPPERSWPPDRGARSNNQLSKS